MICIFYCVSIYGSRLVFIVVLSWFMVVVKLMFSEWMLVGKFFVGKMFIRLLIVEMVVLKRIKSSSVNELLEGK